MSKYRRAARVDANQVEIVKLLRKVPGVTVEVSHDDILCGYQGKTYWFELKNPDTKAKRTEGFRKGKVKDSQIKIKATWTGHYAIVTTFEEILKEMGIQ